MRTSKQGRFYVGTAANPLAAMKMEKGGGTRERVCGMF